MTDQSPTFAVALPSLALIEVGGADAGAFLQGQLSNDIRALAPERAQLSSYNSPKGRMLAVLHVLARGDSYVLELQRSLLDATLKRLRMFVLRSKVTVAEAPLAILGVAGSQAEAVLLGAGLRAPAAALECAWAGEVCVTRRLGDAPRFTVLVPAAQADGLARKLGADPAHATAWKLADIEAGVPTVHPETSDHFVAQMCNLDALGGISFDKGCYTGQEIIARVHYRGAVKRHMQPLRLDGSPPAPG
ncbi:MAG: CAF17-like 4Fe-4S cluster assembly/insertion protein YgfZ, partial [Gammaproteobacteria bacterium]